MLYLMECMRNFGNGTAKAMNSAEKECFFRDLRMFAEGLTDKITQAGKWNIRGFIDIFRNVYALSSDSKVLSKVLELHLLPELMNFAESIGYDIEPAEKQNWYPDFTFISKHDSGIKFAADLKTTYRDEQHPGFCNGFTLTAMESSRRLVKNFSMIIGLTLAG